MVMRDWAFNSPWLSRKQLWRPRLCWFSRRFWRLWSLLEVQLWDHWGGRKVPVHQRPANAWCPLCVQRGRFLHGADVNATSCGRFSTNIVFSFVRSSPYTKSCTPTWGPSSWRSTQDTLSQTDLCQPTSSVSPAFFVTLKLMSGRNARSTAEEALWRGPGVKVLLPLLAFISAAPSREKHTHR